MLVIHTLPLLRKHICRLRQEGKRIALVPTMGNLHAGHIKLIDAAKAHVDIVVVSIFVNPMQFNCVNDLIRYPRTLHEDCKKLDKYCVDLIFAPTLKDMYPKGFKEITYVDVPIISTILEGEYRFKHFRGVSTIVSKFFNLVQPNVSFFGEKDYQQLMVIRKMVVDMDYDIDIIGIPTVRSEDGLALSSRNNYLTIEQRKIAPELFKVINIMEEDFRKRRTSARETIFFAKNKLEKKGFVVEDIQIRDAQTLFELTSCSKNAVILITVWLGKTRLIDNKIIKMI